MAYILKRKFISRKLFKNLEDMKRIVKRDILCSWKIVLKTQKILKE